LTCIVGTTRFICADRRITEDGATSHIVKLASNPWLVAAAAGHASANVAVKAAVRAGAESPADLIACVDSGSYALVLTYDGVLSLISEGVVWPALSRGERVAAIGSGADLALGFLHGAESFSRETARQAQRFVAKRRSDCGGGCDIRGFEGT
jgi:hypothetical protein